MADKLQPWALGAPCYVCGKATSATDHSIRHGHAIHRACWIQWAEKNEHIRTAIDKLALAIEKGEVTLEQLEGVAKRIM